MIVSPAPPEDDGGDITPLEVLRRDGWTQTEVGVKPGERHCIVGAVRCANTVDEEDFIVAAMDVAREQFPGRCTLPFTNGVSLGAFNDHPQTTLADVEAVIEKAQIRLSERVA